MIDVRNDDEITNVRLVHWSVERLTRWLGLLPLMLLGAAIGCQAPVPPTPTPAPPAPTVARPAPTPAPTLAPTTVPTAAATLAPKPTAAAAPPPATASRVETLNAAGTAFTAGDFATAAGLYERVANTPASSGESALVTDFADFRAMVALIADGREDDAHDHLDELRQRDPNSVFGRLGSQLWDQYGMVGGLRGACAQLQPQVASQAGSALSTLQGLGVSVDPAHVCN